MLFWFALTFVCVIFLLFVRVVPLRLRIICPILFCFILFFITGFRYMIGWDYESYLYLFNNVELNDIYPELSFRVISILFRFYGFDYQIIFVFYSMLTFLFLFFAIKKYVENSEEALLALILFVLIPTLYLGSLSTIRQSLAMAIFFWGSKYIITREFHKYLLTILLATVFHYSAVCLIVCYIFNEKYKKSFYIVTLVCSIVVSKLNIAPSILEIIFNSLGIYSHYFNKLNEANFSSGVTIYFYVFLYLLVIAYLDNNNNKENFLINMYSISFFCLFVLSFSDVLYRIRIYFEIFGIVLIAKLIIIFCRKFGNKLGYYILIPFIIIFLFTIYKIPNSVDGKIHPYTSANNINYQFNFKLIK